MLISKKIYQDYVANKELTPQDIAKECETHANVQIHQKNAEETYYTFSDNSVIRVLPHCIQSFANDTEKQKLAVNA